MLADLFDAFLLDLDGVVYVGGEPLPHAMKSLERLRETGKALRFLTNDPRPTRDEAARRLSGMGVQARTDEVVTSGWATAGYLVEAGLHSAYVVGGPGLASEIRDAGVEVVNTGQAEAVVVGADERTSYRHVERAARLIRGGAYFVATNPDGSFPTQEGSSPGAGAIVAAVEVAAGRRPDAIIGKPHRPMFDLALEGLGAEPSRIAVVGDNLETDILGAHQAALAAVLISESPVEFPSSRDFRAPDATIPDLSFLFEPGIEARRWGEPPFPWPERVAAGVAAAVFDSSGRVLLGKRADNGLWGLPSGRVELGETVEEAVRREVREETGLSIEAMRLVGVYSDPASQVFAYPTGEVVQFVTCSFLCRVTGGRLRPDGKETAGVAFFDPGRLPSGILPMHPRWLSDALSTEEAAFTR